MDIGTKDSLLNFQRYAFEVKFDENPKLARKTIKKIARTYFNQTISSNSDIFVSILANSAASAGWINEKTSLEIFFSMFFGMLLSLDTQVSKLGMKMFIEGIKDNKKQQFRELLSQKNGILGRLAEILIHSSKQDFNCNSQIENLQSCSESTTLKDQSLITKQMTNSHHETILQDIQTIQQQSSIQSNKSQSSLQQNNQYNKFPFHVLFNIIDVIQEFSNEGSNEWDVDEKYQLMNALRKLQSKIQISLNQQIQNQNDNQNYDDDDVDEDIEDNEIELLQIRLQNLIIILESQIESKENNLEQLDKSDLINKIKEIQEEKNKSDQKLKRNEEKLIKSKIQIQQIKVQQKNSEQQKQQAEIRAQNAEQQKKQSEQRTNDVEKRRKEVENRVELQKQDFDKRLKIAQEKQIAAEQGINSTTDKQNIIIEKQKLENEITNLKNNQQNLENQVSNLKDNQQKLENEINQLKQPCLIYKQIGEELKKEIKGTDQEKLQILLKKDNLCEVISDSLRGKKEDNLCIKRLIEAGIADALISIFSTQLLDSISKANSNAFFHLTFTNSENKQLLIEKKSYLGLIRLLDHTSITVAFNAIVSIQNIILDGLPPHSSTSKHQHFEIMTEYDGITKIYELFKRKLDKYIVNKATLCLGQLFKAREINDSEMRKDIIKHLKTLINDEDEWIKIDSILRLYDLAQNEVNKAEIEKDGFVIPT